MTRRFVRRNHGNSHSYALDGHKVPGVTTIIKVLDKPALVGWAARESAAYAVEHWDELAGLPIMERADKITRARFESNRRAIVRGHRIHEFGDKISHGVPVEVPDEYRGPAEAYARFLDAWDLQTIATESPVCHTAYRYGGTFDAIAESPRLGRVMIDIKTGSGVYPETALQLAAYRHADLMIDAAGDEQPMISTEGAYVAHVLPDTVDLIPITQDDRVTGAFLYCLELYETWIRRTSRDFRNEPDFDPVIGGPIYPDQLLDRNAS